MNNIILKYLSVENFASFANKVEFTTQIDSGKKELVKKEFTCNGMSFNKVSFIYGANGSGKTFFCKIIREIHRLLEWSMITATNNSKLLSLPQFKGIGEPVATFAFDAAYKEKPTSFAIEIVIEGVTYRYEFSLLQKKVVYELLTKKNKRTEKLMERKSTSYKDIILKSDLKGFESNKNVVKEEALCLSAAALLNNDLAGKIYDAIMDIQVVSMTAATLKPKNSKKAFSDERLQKYIEIMRKADPTIRDIKVSFEESEVEHQNVDEDDFENREVIVKKTTVAVESTHAMYSNGEEIEGKPIKFFADESLGTVKLFTALPYLFDVLEEGGVLIIDEIENGLHLFLAKELVNLFMDERTNPNNAQLICTTHQPLLLEGEFRRDQVWVVSKDEYAKSYLHRLSDLKTSRAKVNLVNKILEGAFVCNPDRFFE